MALLHFLNTPDEGCHIVFGKGR
jgi:hypothetical protein